MTQGFIKQPWEVIPVSVGFSENMEDGETIDKAGSSVAAYDSAGEDISSTILEASSFDVIDSSKLFVIVKAGTVGQRYKVSFRAHISATKKLEEDIRVVIED